MPITSALQSDLYAHTASFLSVRDAGAFSTSCRALRGAGTDAQLICHYPVIQSFDPSTFVGGIAQRQPLIDSAEGRVELVKRVSQTAAAYLAANRHAIQLEDGPMLLVPINTLSYEELNRAGTIIKDRLLLKNIGLIFGQDHAIPLDPRNPLSRNAEIFRNWLINIPNNIDSDGLSGVLYRAVDGRNLEIVQTILQSGRAIDPVRLGEVLYMAVEAGHLEIAQAIFQSRREIDRRERIVTALRTVARGQLRAFTNQFWHCPTFAKPLLLISFLAGSADFAAEKSYHLAKKTLAICRTRRHLE